MVNTVGHRETEKALQLGLLYSVDEALKINLIDEIANDDKDLLACAEKQMLQWSRIPGNTQFLVK
jgi:3,2-trans-enoyl-CoA isomerase